MPATIEELGGHTAEPFTAPFADDSVGKCRHCGDDIRRVIGGGGRVWIHSDGYVVSFKEDA